MMSEKEFDQLLKKYEQGKTTSSEDELIERWFDRLKQKKRDRTKEELSLIGSEIFSSIKRKALSKVSHPAQAKKPFVQFWKYAAVLALFFLGAYLSHSIYSTHQNKSWIKKISANGQQLELTLEDGTKVFLNAESSISYPKKFSRTNRTVKVTGEAFFEVSKDAQRPFKVITETLTTEVLGTAFNVNVYPGESPKVSVLEGKVQVQTVRDSPNKAMLTANEEATLTNAGNLIKQRCDMEAVLAWKSGMINLNQASLEDLGRIIQRNYNIQIVYETSELAKLTLSGKFKKDSLSNLLNQIKFIKNIDWERTSENTILLKFNHHQKP
ncbi:FecR family protein [Echinicola sediminis]